VDDETEEPETFEECEKMMWRLLKKRRRIGYF
jgi:hypothetical protein